MTVGIKKICISALVIRLIVLSIVVVFSNNLTTGFLSSEIYNDDVRYQLGAELYAKQAKHIIDSNAIGDAFLQVGDYSVAYGYAFVLWYWIVSIVMYVFHSHVILRIMNIMFAVASVKCIYDIAKHLYGNRVANFASALYAFLPYPVFFSCFLYKDQFYTLLVLLIFRVILLKGARMELRDFGIVAFLIVISTFIRSGLSVIIAFIAIYVYFRSKGFSISNYNTILIIVITIIGTFFLFQYNLDSIDTKYEAYVLNYHDSGSGAASFIAIKSIGHFYRYPLAYLFVMLLPIKTSSSIVSWGDVVGLLNFVVIPIALGNLLYLVFWNIKKSPFFGGVQILYFITIVTSMGIFRHSYYLQPYMMIFFAAFYLRLKIKERRLYNFILLFPMFSYFAFLIYSLL